MVDKSTLGVVVVRKGNAHDVLDESPIRSEEERCNPVKRMVVVTPTVRVLGVMTDTDRVNNVVTNPTERVGCGAHERRRRRVAKQIILECDNVIATHTYIDKKTRGHKTQASQRSEPQHLGNTLETGAVGAVGELQGYK